MRSILIATAVGANGSIARDACAAVKTAALAVFLDEGREDDGDDDEADKNLGG
jgi:hypothetical protein